MDIGEFRSRYDLSNSDLAKMFGYKNVNSYNRSAGKARIESALLSIVELVKKKSTTSGIDVDCCAGCGCRK